MTAKAYHPEFQLLIIKDLPRWNNWFEILLSNLNIPQRSQVIKFKLQTAEGEFLTSIDESDIQEVNIAANELFGKIFPSRPNHN